MVRVASLVGRSSGLHAEGPPGMDIAAGEYGYTIDYFERMLQAQAVDCQQADLTRCGGVTGFLRVAALCEAQSHRSFRSLRSSAAFASRLRRAASTSSRMVSRPRADRAYAV